jgi:tellurite resistance protein
MQSSRIKNAIIGTMIMLLTPWMAGCSAIRLGYANGPQLAWWWLDGYVDFSREQTPAAKQAIDRWFDWHRSSQLSEYAALLASAQAPMMESTTGAQACRWQGRIRDQLEPALEQAVVEFADLLPSLGEAQFKHLERSYAKRNDEMRTDFLQPDAQTREKESVKRAVDRAEQLYGSLEANQVLLIARGVAASPFNPEAWIAERQRRQQDTLQTLRRLVAERADRDTRHAALRALLARTERSPDPDYRAYQIRLTQYNCGLAAQIHNATTAAQRQKARERLKGWEEDLRALAAPAVN